MPSLQEIYSATKQRSLEAIQVDLMAAWLISTILAAKSEDFPEPKHILIGDGAPRGWALHVSAHRQEFAGTLEHVRVDQTLVGRLVLRQVLGEGEYGPIIYTALVDGFGVTHPDGDSVSPQYVGESTTEAQIQRRIAIGMLFAIQEALPVLQK